MFKPHGGQGPIPLDDDKPRFNMRDLLISSPLFIVRTLTLVLAILVLYYSYAYSAESNWYQRLLQVKPSQVKIHFASSKCGLSVDWIGLDWTGLDWTGLDWTGLDWTGLLQVTRIDRLDILILTLTLTLTSNRTLALAAAEHPNRPPRYPDPNPNPDPCHKPAAAGRPN